MDYTENLLKGSWVHSSILQNYTFFCEMDSTFDIRAKYLNMATHGVYFPKCI